MNDQMFFLGSEQIPGQAHKMDIIQLRTLKIENNPLAVMPVSLEMTDLERHTVSPENSMSSSPWQQQNLRLVAPYDPDSILCPRAQNTSRYVQS